MRQEIEVIKCTVKSRLLPLIYRKRRRRVSLITSHSRACDLHWACVALSGRCVPRDVILTKNTRRKCAGGQIVVASYESQQSPCAFLKASFLSFLILHLSNSSHNQTFSSIQQTTFFAPFHSPWPDHRYSVIFSFALKAHYSAVQSYAVLCSFLAEAILHSQ